MFNIAQLADNDLWRQRLRDPKVLRDREELERLAKAEAVLAQPPGSLLLLYHALTRANGRTTAAARLRCAQRRYPADYWLNMNLGTDLMAADSTREAAIGYLRAAVALRPQSPSAINNLGLALAGQGNFPDAIDAYQKAIELRPRYFGFYVNLSNAYAAQEKWSKAVEYAKKAIEVNKDEPRGYISLGNAFRAEGKLPEAVNEFNKAIKVKHDYASGYSNLGRAFYDQGNFTRAVEKFLEAIDHEPNLAQAYLGLGLTFDAQNKLLEAEGAYLKLIEIQADFAQAYHNLGANLNRQKRPGEAETALRKAILLKPNYPRAYANLARALQDQGRFAEALAALKHAQKLDVHKVWPSLQIGPWIDSVERLVKLDAKLLQLMKVETKGLSAAECIELARFCKYEKKHYISAVGFYQEAFRANPELVDNFMKYHRFWAAVTAVLASRGQDNGGGKLTAADRIAMRKQAYDWLQADLDSMSKQFQRQPGIALNLATGLPLWQTIPDLAGVRDDQNLAKFPEAERESWQKLWADVEKLRKQAAGMFEEIFRRTGTVNATEREPFYDVELQAGRTYVIDLESTAFEPLLVLPDAKGKKVGPISRLVFTPKTDASYRLVASAFQNSGVGPYTLTVRAFVK